MEHSVGVGIIVGLVITSSIYIWNNENFSKEQKIGLLICLVFPPAQWLGILIVLIYNNYKESYFLEKTSKHQIVIEKDSLDDSITKLSDLKQKGIITDEEYKTKIEKIEFEKEEKNIRHSIEYKQLKSLFDSGILTNDEFESKIKILKENNSFFKLETKYRIVDGFKENLAVAVDKDLNYGFIDTNQDIIIDFKFEYAENFSNGFALVRENSLFGYIDKYSNYIIKPKYENAKSFIDNKASVSMYGKTFYINKEGHTLD